MFDEEHILSEISHHNNEKAFKLLFLHYFPKVKGFINCILQSPDESEDIAQDIFLTLWKNRESLHQINHFKTYLFRACRNATYRHIEREILFSNYQKGEMENHQSEPLENTTENEIQCHELELLIKLVVERMPSQRKKIYQMSREEGKNNEEIANLLGISKRTVENHLSLALADIKKIVSLFFLLFI